MTDSINQTPDSEIKTPDDFLDSAGETDLTVSPRRAAERARWAEIAFVIALVLFGVLALLAHTYAYFAWDLRIDHAIQSIELPGFGPLMIGLSWLGSGIAPTIMVLGVGLSLILTRFRLEGTVCIVGTSLGALLNSLIKLAIDRPRPDPGLVEVLRHYKESSFPSGHVEFFVIFFGFLLFLCYVLLKRGPLRVASFVVLGLLIALIGPSRVYMGAHWPSDTLGAYLWGGMLLMILIEIYRRLKARQQPSGEQKSTA